MCSSSRLVQQKKNGNTQVNHEKSELLADDDPAPKVEYTRRFIFGASLNKDGMVVCGSFFLESQVKALEEAWPFVESSLAKYGISCTMYLAERFMTFSTTSSTKDPDIIYKARDVIELLATTDVPPSMAMKVLNGRLQHDIIKTGYYNGGLRAKYRIKKKLQFYERCARIDSVLKDLACGICRNRATVTALGTSPQGFKLVRFVVKRCIVNNANPATLLWKIKRRCELNKRDGAHTSPIVLAEEELDLDQVLREVQFEEDQELLSLDPEI